MHARDCSQVQLRNGREAVNLDQLLALFDLAAFWAQDRCRSDMEIAIANSYPVITAWDGELLMGFARATSDGIYRATIWDVVVHPAYQGGGIGRKLVETIVTHPHVCRVERVYLMTTQQQVFYEKIGFQTNSTTTMVLYNYPLHLPVGISGEEVECDLGLG